MSFEVEPTTLRREMARRGISASELARVARISPQTVGAALSGRSISESSARLISSALVEVPVVAMLDLLLKGGPIRTVE